MDGNNNRYNGHTTTRCGYMGLDAATTIIMVRKQEQRIHCPNIQKKDRYSSGNHLKSIQDTSEGGSEQWAEYAAVIKLMDRREGTIGER